MFTESCNYYLLNSLIDQVRNRNVYLTCYAEQYRARCDNEELDSLLYLLLEFRSKLKSGDKSARYVRCWLEDGYDVIKHDECVGMCLFPDEVREFLSYDVYYTVEFPFCSLRYLLSEANASASDYPEVESVLSCSSHSIIRHLVHSYHISEMTASSMVTRLVNGEAVLEEWPVTDVRLAALNAEIEALLARVGERTQTTAVRRAIYYGTRSLIIHIASCVQQQCDSPVLPYEYGLLVPMADKSVVMAYLAEYLNANAYLSGMRVSAVMNLPPILQIENWTGEGIAFSLEKLNACWKRDRKEAFRYLDAYFFAVEETTHLLFVDYMHQCVRRLVDEKDLLDFLSFDHLQLVEEWRHATTHVVHNVVSLPFVGVFSLQRAVREGVMNTFFGLNPCCFRDRDGDGDGDRDGDGDGDRDDDKDERELALHLFHRLTAAVAENNDAYALWLKQAVAHMLLHPSQKPTRGVVLMDEHQVYAEEWLKSVQSLFACSSAVCLDYDARRRQRQRDFVSRALLVHYHSDRAMQPETMEWLSELAHMKRRVDFTSESDVCVRPSYCRVFVTAASPQCVPFSCIRDHALYEFFRTDSSALSRTDLIVFSALRRRPWFPSLLLRSLMETDVATWDWRMTMDTRLFGVLVESFVESSILFVLWYLAKEKGSEMRCADDVYEEYRQYCLETGNVATTYLCFVRIILIEFFPVVDYVVVDNVAQFRFRMNRMGSSEKEHVISNRSELNCCIHRGSKEHVVLSPVLCVC